MLKLTTDKHEASRGLSATDELLVHSMLKTYFTSLGLSVRFYCTLNTQYRIVLYCIVLYRIVRMCLLWFERCPPKLIRN